MSMAVEAQVQDSLKKLEGIDFLAIAERWGLKLLGAVLILVIGIWLARWLTSLLERAFTRANMEATLRGFLRNIAYAVMLVVVFVASLQALDVPTTSILAVLGAAGLGIGLALKDSLSNIASGVMLMAQRPFRVGDHIQAASIEGTVVAVRVFQTRLRTVDNRAIILPNSLITNAPIINFTANPKRRIDLAVGVGYDDDLKIARATLFDVAGAHPRVIKDPKPDVLVTELADSSVKLLLRVWVKTADVVQVRSDLTEAVRNEVLGRGLNLPYPRRDLHVYHHDADGRPLGELLVQSVADGDDVAAAPPPKT